MALRSGGTGHLSLGILLSVGLLASAQLTAINIGADASTCRPGYIFDASVGRCGDLNECAEQTTLKPRCKDGFVCVNSIGSFRCTCPTGTVARVTATGTQCMSIANACPATKPIRLTPCSIPTTTNCGYDQVCPGECSDGTNLPCKNVTTAKCVNGYWRIVSDATYECPPEDDWSADTFALPAPVVVKTCPTTKPLQSTSCNVFWTIVCGYDPVCPGPCPDGSRIPCRNTTDARCVDGLWQLARVADYGCPIVRPPPPVVVPTCPTTKPVTGGACQVPSTTQCGYDQVCPATCQDGTKLPCKNITTATCRNGQWFLARLADYGCPIFSPPPPAIITTCPVTKPVDAATCNAASTLVCGYDQVCPATCQDGTKLPCKNITTATCRNGQWFLAGLADYGCPLVPPKPPTVTVAPDVPTCPTTRPADGATCQLPATTQCAYDQVCPPICQDGTKLPCNNITTATCRNGQWFLARLADYGCPIIPPPPPAVITTCPATKPVDAATCNVATRVSCSYDQVCPATCQDGTKLPCKNITTATCRNGQWFLARLADYGCSLVPPKPPTVTVAPDVPTCPTTRPADGAACQLPATTQCAYDQVCPATCQDGTQLPCKNVTTATCRNGQWSLARLADYGCPPIPPTPPTAITTCPATKPADAATCNIASTVVCGYDQVCPAPCQDGTKLPCKNITEARCTDGKWRLARLADYRCPLVPIPPPVVAFKCPATSPTGACTAPATTVCGYNKLCPGECLDGTVLPCKNRTEVRCVSGKWVVAELADYSCPDDSLLPDELELTNKENVAQEVPVCPAVKPTIGGACQLPATTECSYDSVCPGTCANGSKLPCKNITTATCRNGQWLLARLADYGCPIIPPAPPAVITTCSATKPADAATCNVASTVVCGYDQVCPPTCADGSKLPCKSVTEARCTDGKWRLARLADYGCPLVPPKPPTVIVAPDVPTCPTTRPADGAACQLPATTQCAYDQVCPATCQDGTKLPCKNITTATCRNGQWFLARLADYGCPIVPVAPPTVIAPPTITATCPATKPADAATCNVASTVVCGYDQVCPPTCADGSKLPCKNVTETRCTDGKWRLARLADYGCPLVPPKPPTVIVAPDVPTCPTTRPADGAACQLPATTQCAYDQVCPATCQDGTKLPCKNITTATCRNGQWFLARLADYGCPIVPVAPPTVIAPPTITATCPATKPADAATCNVASTVVCGYDQVCPPTCADGSKLPCKNVTETRCTDGKWRLARLADYGCPLVPPKPPTVIVAPDVPTCPTTRPADGAACQLPATTQCAYDQVCPATCQDGTKLPCKNITTATCRNGQWFLARLADYGCPIVPVAPPTVIAPPTITATCPATKPADAATCNVASTVVCGYDQVCPAPCQDGTKLPCKNITEVRCADGKWRLARLADYGCPLIVPKPTVIAPAPATCPASKPTPGSACQLPSTLECGFDQVCPPACRDGTKLPCKNLTTVTCRNNQWNVATLADHGCRDSQFPTAERDSVDFNPDVDGEVAPEGVGEAPPAGEGSADSLGAGPEEAPAELTAEDFALE